MNTLYDQNDKGMDKRTFLAIVLMVVVVTLGTTVTNLLFPPANVPPPESALPAGAATMEPAAEPAPVQPELALPEVDAPVAEELTVVKTDLLEATLSNKGGQLVSLKLLKHLEDGQPVELLLGDKDGVDGFSLALGGPDAKPLADYMNLSRPQPGVVEFSRTYFYQDAAGQAVPYTLRRTYEFKDGDYMFRVSVGFENSKAEPLPLGSGGTAYTLTIGPQIGPRFSHLPKNADFRKIVTLENGKRKVINPKNGRQSFENRVSWAAVAGKYFTLMAVPDQVPYTFTYTNVASGGYPVTSAMQLSRPSLQASAQTDSFYVYAGPKSSRDLSKYDDPAVNGFKRVNDRLEDVMEGGNMLGWLETILKWVMNFFHSLVGNYGVAIILLTLLVRGLMFPLTFKGSKSTARMQELQPKIQEIQAKYKSNPQKLNIEMAEFYKREGYNPLSGCLPMLIQLPIFIAMYALFNNHFDLRGASFIPGWIDDLSLPEAIVTFPTVNLILWKVSALRALPIIYLLSQLLYGKFMQTPNTSAQSQGQMKFMMYGMPIIFFFVLYDMPSGLLVYWIAANILTIIQQIVINEVVHKKRGPVAVASPKLAPDPRRKGVKNGR